MEAQKPTLAELLDQFSGLSLSPIQSTLPATKRSGDQIPSRSPPPFKQQLANAYIANDNLRIARSSDQLPTIKQTQQINPQQFRQIRDTETVSSGYSQLGRVGPLRHDAPGGGAPVYFRPAPLQPPPPAGTHWTSGGGFLWQSSPETTNEHRNTPDKSYKMHLSLFMVILVCPWLAMSTA